MENHKTACDAVSLEFPEPLTDEELESLPAGEELDAEGEDEKPLTLLWTMVSGWKDRQDAGMSRCNDGDMTWPGRNFTPIREISGTVDGKPVFLTEDCNAYLGGHTFRSDSTNQLIRATSEVTGVPEERCALTVLFAISSAIGKGLLVRFKGSPLFSVGNLIR